MIPLVTNLRDEHTAMPMLGEAQISIHQYRLTMIWGLLVCILAVRESMKAKILPQTGDPDTTIDMGDSVVTNQQIISFSGLPAYLYDRSPSILIQLEDPITGSTDQYHL